MAKEPTKIMNNDEPNEPPEKREREILRDLIAAQSEVDLTAYFDRFIERIRAENRAAAQQQDTKTLKRNAADIARHIAKLNEWNEASGKHASEKLKTYVEVLGLMRDDIYAALNGELPGQSESDSGEEWKKGGDE